MFRPNLLALSIVTSLSAAGVASAQPWAPNPYAYRPIVRPVVQVPIGKTIVPPGYALYPTYPTYTPPVTSYYPAPVHLNRRDLERHIEHRLRAHFGSCIDDIEVDLDLRRRDVEVDIEFRHHVPGAHARARHLVECMPELAGFRIRVEVDFD